MIETQVVSTTRVLEIVGVCMLAFSRRFDCILKCSEVRVDSYKLSLYTVKERKYTSQKYLHVKKV